MTHSFDIRFEPAHLDRVTFAVAPFDAFTGRLVTEGVEASITGLPDKPVRNRSGLLVFINLPAQPQYSFSVRAKKAGYFDPPPLTFVPPADRRRSVALFPMPDWQFAEATTLLRGLVVRGGQPVAGAEIELEPLHNLPTGFETQTTAAGAFALPLRLPPLLPAQNEEPVPITLHAKKGTDERVLTREVRSGTSYRFDAPIDLLDLEQPQLIEI